MVVWDRQASLGVLGSQLLFVDMKKKNSLTVGGFTGRKTRKKTNLNCSDKIPMEKVWSVKQAEMTTTPQLFYRYTAVSPQIKHKQYPAFIQMNTQASAHTAAI